MQKKYLTILFAVVLLIIILVLAKSGVKKPSPNLTAGNTASTTQAGVLPFAPVTTLPSSQISKAMPANLPFEKGAQILQNFEVKNPSTGKTQATRVYVSAKTIDQNFTIYQKYLKDNGWSLTSSLSQPEIKNLDATKSGARLDITISKDAKGQVTVNVSYVD